MQFNVPMFQRLYVWDQEQQWDPLWDDVSALAERLLEEEEDEQSCQRVVAGAPLAMASPR